MGYSDSLNGIYIKLMIYEKQNPAILRGFVFYTTNIFYFRSMIQQWLNGKTLLFIIAVSIVTGTIFYSRYLSEKIANDEKKKVEIWVEAQKTMITATTDASFNLAAKISS